MPSILIVDDEAGIRTTLAGALGREGYAPEVATSLDEARAKLRESYDFVLLDVRFPKGDGLELLAAITSGAPETTVIMMSGHATIDTAVRATRLGAYDFLEKPMNLERLLVVLRNAAAARALRAENRSLRRVHGSGIVGNSPAIRSLLSEIERVGPTPARVLIQGEHGTGKELVARALHAASSRRTMPFVAVNCAAIPEELIESEWFGHERGAFTGATQARRGRFEEAHGGTLFLDEVGDLSPRAQTKLLRVLQEGEFQRLGGSRNVRVDVRVLSATNRELAGGPASGFREDLYFRLAVIPLVVPPLRERRTDIALLVDHFRAVIGREISGTPPTFTREALAMMSDHDYPGNVRELRNLVERLLIMNLGPQVGADAVRSVLRSPAVVSKAGPTRLRDSLRRFERSEIESALADAAGSVTRAAERLGLERSHLYKKMRKHGLTPGD
jgi:DNA-binding NtrC family response regulator